MFSLWWKHATYHRTLHRVSGGILTCWLGAAFKASIKLLEFLRKKKKEKRFHILGLYGGPVVKILPCCTGDTGSGPGWRTKVPRVAEQLSSLNHN